MRSKKSSAALVREKSVWQTLPQSATRLGGLGADRVLDDSTSSASSFSLVSYPYSSVAASTINVWRAMGKGKGKEDRIYIAPLSTHAYSQSAQAWITQFCLQITPCLHFLRKRSPDGATTTEVADIQLQLTALVSTFIRAEWITMLADCSLYISIDAPQPGGIWVTYRMEWNVKIISVFIPYLL